MGYDRGDSFPFNFLNQIDFHLVQNRKENCNHDHIPLNLKGNGNIVFSVHQLLQSANEVTSLHGQKWNLFAWSFFGVDFLWDFVLRCSNWWRKRDHFLLPTGRVFCFVFFFLCCFFFYSDWRWGNGSIWLEILALRAESRVSLLPFGTILLGCSRSFMVTLNGTPTMPRVASLSDGCTPDRCSNFSLASQLIYTWLRMSEARGFPVQIYPIFSHRSNICCPNICYLGCSP